MLAPNIVLNRCVDVEAANANCFERNDAAKADDRRLAGSAANVDDHVANRFVDRKVGADCGSHGLFDELCIGCACTAGRIGDCSALDLGDGRRHADDHLGSGETADANTLQQQADHALGDLEVGDGPAAKWANGHDVSGSTADHLPRLAPGCKYFAGLAVERNDRGFVQHNAAALHVHERVRRAEIDREVAGHVLSTSLCPIRVRSARAQ